MFIQILGEICAAKFKEDQQWYRAKVEKVAGPSIHVLYIDYGNRDIVTADECANLPPTFKNDRPYAKEYGFALVKLPKLPEYQEDSIAVVRDEFINKTININEEYTYDNLTHITVKDADKKEDLVKKLVEEGFLLVERRRERYLQKLVILVVFIDKLYIKSFHVFYYLVDRVHRGSRKG